ncbi:phage protease [Campylobacter sp. CNRCH_2014_0184h]|uniref:phage protease n=1 Tax=Campylobacter sp. CNRCH_2014_0184h TaxID=2911602 RepID=UPI0021E67DD0|nr:phage protease [Campylobacter sp. CNRCH_2014_0184h]MCV3482151.1 phage protease [Campylobacter sp. CNRCH_2014_0184h]
MFFINKENLVEASNDKPIKVAIKGEWKGHANGVFKIDDKNLESMIDNFNQKKIDIVIDYEHQTLKNEKAPAAGWIKELFLENDALMAKAEFNEEAKKYIANKQYRYLSPVFEFNAKDNKSGKLIRAKLHSVALTNTPFIDELDELIANKNNQNKGVKMDEKIKELEFQIIALKDENGLLKKENEDLKKQNEESTKDLANSLVENALSSGKIANSQKEWALTYACKDLEGFTAFINSAPEINNMQNNKFANKNTPNNNEELDVVKMMLEA